MLELDLKEGWKPKNLCLWTVVLEKTLESFLDYKENKPFITIGNQPWNSLEGLMLKLKLQYFGHLMQRADSLEKTLRLGKTEGEGEGGGKGWDSYSITDSTDMNLTKLVEIVKGREAWSAAVHGVAHNLGTEQ